MKPEFFELPEEAADYPPAAVSILPTGHTRTSPPRSGIPVRMRFDRDDVTYTRDGRTAIGIVLRDCGIGPSDEVLVPSYHCITMIEPVAGTGATAIFFRVNEDLTLNLDDLTAKATSRTRAVLIPHYFGFMQPIQDLLEWSSHRGILVIEDCAHALYYRDKQHGFGFGFHGDYAIASIRKFLPCSDGGAACRNPARTLTETPERPPMGQQLRGIWRPLESALNHGRYGHLRTIHSGLRRLVGEGKKQRPPIPARGSPTEGATSRPPSSSFSMTMASHMILNRTRHELVAAQRRLNYTDIVQALTSIEGIRPLFPCLPDHVVPYMIPAIIDHPNRLFPALKRAKVPMWRWEQIARSDCPVSLEYRTRLVHLPCHQSLRSSEKEWLVDTIKRVCTDVHI